MGAASGRHCGWWRSKTTLTAFDLGEHRSAGLRHLVDHIHDLAGIGIGHVILCGPRFEWGDDLDAVLSIVDEVHDIVPSP